LCWLLSYILFLWFIFNSVCGFSQEVKNIKNKNIKKKYRASLVNIVLNNKKLGAFVILIKDKEIFLSLKDYQSLGFKKVPKTIVINEKKYVSLNSLFPLITYNFDAKEYLLTIKAKPDLISKPQEKKKKKKKKKSFLAFLATVVVNKQKAGDFIFLVKDKKVFLSLEDFEALGFGEAPETVIINGKKYVPLDSLSPCITYSFKEKEYLLTINWRPELRPLVEKKKKEVAIKQIKKEKAKKKEVEKKEMKYEPLIVTVIFNKEEKGEHVILAKGDEVFFPLEEFKSLGFREIPETVNVEGENYVPLDSLSPLLNYSLDKKKYLLTLDANPEILETKIVNLKRKVKKTIPVVKKTKKLNGFVNYSLRSSGNNKKTFQNFSGSFEAGLHIRDWLLISNFASNYFQKNSDEKKFKFVRLMSRAIKMIKKD